MAVSGAPASPLDKSVVNATTSTIPVSTFIYTLRAMLESIAVDSSDTMSRVAHLGEQVGRRTVGLAVANDRSNQAQFRDLTTEEATRFVATVMWKRWFDHPAYKNFNHANYNYIEDDVSIIPLALCAELNHNSSEGMSFVAGMIKGALEACGFNCEVNAVVHIPEKPTEKAQTQFGIQWAPVVLQRDRRRLLQQ